MLYFGENNGFILAECDVCKGEIYIEKDSVNYEDEYKYTMSGAVRCVCGQISGEINKSGKSCHDIKQELSALSELLHTQRGVSEKITSINAEISKTVRPPHFGTILLEDLMFSFKIMMIVLGIAVGAEILVVVVGCLMFFCGLAFQMPDLSIGGNEIMYNLNVFKEHGGTVLAKFGASDIVPSIADRATDKELIFDYFPYAVTGLIAVVFYIFVAVLIIRLVITLVRLGFFTSRVVKRRVSVNMKKEQYANQLSTLGLQYDDLEDRIKEYTILPEDYKNIKATDTIFAYFINNRVDTVREAINLFHEEDLKVRAMDYQRAIYSELRQTKRYAKALYILSVDEDAKVDVKDELPTQGRQSADPESMSVGEILKNSYKKLRHSPQENPRLATVQGEPVGEVAPVQQDRLPEPQSEQFIEQQLPQQTAENTDVGQ